MKYFLIIMVIFLCGCGASRKEMVAKQVQTPIIKSQVTLWIENFNRKHNRPPEILITPHKYSFYVMDKYNEGRNINFKTMARVVEDDWNPNVPYYTPDAYMMVKDAPNAILIEIVDYSYCDVVASTTEPISNIKDTVLSDFNYPISRQFTTNKSKNIIMQDIEYLKSQNGVYSVSYNNSRLTIVYLHSQQQMIESYLKNNQYRNTLSR